eukprot:gene20532-13481_t
MPPKRKASAAPQGAVAKKKAAPQGTAAKKKAGGGGGGSGGGAAVAAGDGENNERMKARARGKATLTTTLVSNKGRAASGMPGPGKSSAIGAKCTVEAAEDEVGGGNVDIAKHNNHMEVVQLLNGAVAKDGDTGGA